MTRFRCRCGYFCQGQSLFPFGLFAKIIGIHAARMNKFKSESIKHRRLNLVKEFYMLKKKKAHLPNALSLDKMAWEKLVREWLIS